MGVDVQQGDWTREEDEARARWAYSEAKRLLQVSGAQRAACYLVLAACYALLATCVLAACHLLPLTYRCYILSQRYSGLREKLQESMVTGVSVGDCALLVEERLKNQWGSV